MTAAQNFEQTLGDLIAFQCALVALRGVGAEASEEMLWQTLLGALVEQYGFGRVWYGRSAAGGGIRPAVSAPVLEPGMEDLPEEIDGLADSHERRRYFAGDDRRPGRRAPGDAIGWSGDGGPGGTVAPAGHGSCHHGGGTAGARADRRGAQAGEMAGGIGESRQESAAERRECVGRGLGGRTFRPGPAARFVRANRGSIARRNENRRERSGD